LSEINIEIIAVYVTTS